MNRIPYAAIIASAALLAGCSARGYYVRDGDHSYQVASTNAAGGPYEDLVYQCAYQLCRDKHHAGYQTVKPPDYTEGGSLEGSFSCQGPVDSDLTAKYSRSAPFVETDSNGQVTDFKWGGGL